MKTKHLNALLLFSWLFAACGDQQPPSSPAELVVAEVGDKSITAAEFAEFSSMIPEGMHQGATPLAVARNLPQQLDRQGVTPTRSPGVQHRKYDLVYRRVDQLRTLAHPASLRATGNHQQAEHQPR